MRMKLTEAQIDGFRARLVGAPRGTLAALAREHGITLSYASQIAHGRRRNKDKAYPVTVAASVTVTPGAGK